MTINSETFNLQTIDGEKISHLYVAKVGFLWLKLKKDFHDKVFQKVPSDENLSYQFLEEIIICLEKSHSFIDISPPIGILKEWIDSGSMLLHSSKEEETIYFGKFIKIRVVKPRRKNKRFQTFSTSWNPEEFTLYFNGELFFAIAETSEYIDNTDIANIARDLLIEALSDSKLWDINSYIEPKSLHQKIYFQVLQVDRNLAKDKYHQGSDVYFNFCDKKSYLEGLDIFMWKLLVVVSPFYTQRIEGYYYSRSVFKLLSSNSHLNNLIASYFAENNLMQFMSSKPKEIRFLIASMHSMMQEIAHHEEKLRNAKKIALENIENTDFLKEHKNYFERQMDSDIVFNRDAQLNMMNFASSESNNSSTIQATVFAAVFAACFSIFPALLGK